MGVLEVHRETGHRVEDPPADLTLVLAPVEPVVGRVDVVDLGEEGDVLKHRKKNSLHDFIRAFTSLLMNLDF